jgi:hypothetical protein
MCVKTQIYPVLYRYYKLACTSHQAIISPTLLATATKANAAGFICLLCIGCLGQIVPARLFKKALRQNTGTL